MKGLKKFRHFITYNKTVVYVAHSVVCEYIMEGEIIEKRANWITKILEYDIDVKPTKVIYGKGLCEYMAQDDELPKGEVQDKIVLTNTTPTKRCWVTNKKEFMQTGRLPSDLPPEKIRFYRL